MKKSVFILILAVLVLFSISALPGSATARVVVSGSVWVGPGWWGPWYGPSYYPYYPYYQPYNPQPVIIQQQAPQAEQQSYWYFCTNPKGYYPYIAKCPSGWLKVVPSTVPPDQGMDGAPTPYSPSDGK
ncbi:MAG: hypothetical protein ACLPN1_01605 [Dissulfurispiraceae bacterium]